MSRKKKNFVKKFQVPLKITLATIMNITNRHLEKRNERKNKQKNDLCFEFLLQQSIRKSFFRMPSLYFCRHNVFIGK